MKRILICFVMLVALCSIVYSAGLGVSPATVEYKDALRNRVYTKEIIIQNTAKYPVNVTLEIVDYSNWFTFPEVIEIPAAMFEDGIYKQPGTARVPISLKVPRRTPLGSYETMAYASVRHNDFIIRIGFKIRVEVTKEKIYCGYVDNIRTRDVIQGKPLRILVGYANCGNIRHRMIVKTNITTMDGVQIKQFRRRFRFEPYTSNTIEAQFKRTNKLEPQRYKANVKIYMKNKKELELLANKEVYFLVT